MTQYDWVMGILSDSLKFPEEKFSDLKKMEFESKGFFERLVPLIIDRVTSKDHTANVEGVRSLFISKEYEVQWKEDLKKENEENRQKVKIIS